MQPIVGRLVDHYGVRRVLSLSVLLVGLGILAASFARSTSQLLVLYGLVASIGFGGASGVTASVAEARWFQARRSLAFASIEAGFGAGQLLLVLGLLLAIGARRLESPVPRIRGRTMPPHYPSSQRINALF